MTGFLYACERCDDLTENTPDHRGRVRCRACGGEAPDGFTVTVLGGSGVRSRSVEEPLTPDALTAALSVLDPERNGITVLSISTVGSIQRDLEGPRQDPYEFERSWLTRIGCEHLLPQEAWGAAA